MPGCSPRCATQIARVPCLQLPDSKDPRELEDVQVVGGLAVDFQPAEPGMAIREGRGRFDEGPMRDHPQLAIDAPGDGGRQQVPAAEAMVMRSRRGHADDVNRESTGGVQFRLQKSPRGHLKGERVGWQKRHAAGQ